MNTVNNFKACLFCGQSIRSAATLCRFCKKPQTGNGTTSLSQPQTDETMKPCCSCGQQIKKQALLCRYCRQPQTEAPAIPQQNNIQSPVNNSSTKPCPHCGQSIKAIAIKCRYCKQDVPNISAPSTETSNPSEKAGANSQINQIAPTTLIAEATSEPPAADSIVTPIADKTTIVTPSNPAEHIASPVPPQTLATTEAKREISAHLTDTSDMKTCPHCGENIKAIAIKCRYCKHNLDSEANVSAQVSQDTDNNTPSVAVPEKTVVIPAINTAPVGPAVISPPPAPQMTEAVSIAKPSENEELATLAIESVKKSPQEIITVSQTTIEEPITTDKAIHVQIPEPQDYATEAKTTGIQETANQKSCPFCGESIKAVAILCRYCKQNLVEASAPFKPEPPQTPAIEIPAPVSQPENSSITAVKTVEAQNQETATNVTATTADIPVPAYAEVPSIKEPTERTATELPVTDETTKKPEQIAVSDVALKATTVEITGTPSEDTTKQETVEQTTAEAPVITQEDTNLKTCPFCGEQIKAIAVLCRYCKQHLPDTQNDTPAEQTDSPSSTESVVASPTPAAEKTTQAPLTTSDIRTPDNNAPSEAELPKATEPQKKKPSTIIYIVIGLIIAALLGGGALFLMNRNKQEAPAPQASPNNITPEPTASSTPPEALPPNDKSEGATGRKIPAPKLTPKPKPTPKPVPKPTQGTKIKGDIDW